MRINKNEFYKLQQALEAVRMERAHFGTDENTEKIKEETRLYRNTWIIARLEYVLHAIEEREKK